MLTPEQKAIRRLGIGGSEIAAVVGQNPYATPLDVWLAKVEGWEPEVTPAMERGIFLEDGVAAWYAHRTGATLAECSTVQHRARPVALCTPDRLALLPEHSKPRLLSIKVPGPNARESWGEPGTDDVPMSYVLQLQWEFAVYGSHSEIEQTADLAAPIDGDLRIYRVTSDPELQEMLLEEAERFWADYVAPRRQPEIDASESWTRYLSRKFPTSGPLRDATLAEEALALELQEAEAAFDVVEARKDEAKNRIREAIGDAGGLTGAFGRITWKANTRGVRSLRTQWEKKR